MGFNVLVSKMFLNVFWNLRVYEISGMLYNQVTNVNALLPAKVRSVALISSDQFAMFTSPQILVAMFMLLKFKRDAMLIL